MPLIPRLWNLVINQMKTLDIVAVWWLCINPFAPFCLVIFVSSGVGKLRRLHSLLLLHMGSSRGPCTDLALSPLCQVPSVSHKNYLLVFCFSSQPATLDQLLSFQPFCLLGRSGETLAIKPSRWPWALGVCLLPALSCWYRLCCLRYLAHSVLVSPPFYWLPAPSLQATFVPAKWGDLPSLSTAAPFPGQLCRDTRSPPAPDLPRPLRTSVVPLCPCLNPESNVPSIFPCASFISTAQLLRQVIHPVKARTGCSLLFYQTRRVTCMSSVSVS